MAYTAPNHVIGALALAMAALAGLAAPASSAQADTLLIENVVGKGSPEARPARGSSMAAVERRFGTPAQRSGPVGKPPITRWEYPDFVVFFEYDHVVHSVQR